MRFITRSDVEFYLKSSHAEDPVIKAVLEIVLQIMRERGMDCLENNPSHRVVSVHESS